MKLVQCSQEYWDFVRVLRTHPLTQSGFIHQVEITPEQQRAYMAKHAHEYWICLVDGKPAGFVGVVDGDIRVCTHPDYQKRGIAKFMLASLPIEGLARVKVENDASNALFLSAGYVPAFTLYEKKS